MNRQTSDFIKKTSAESVKKRLQDGMGYVTIVLLSVVYLATSFVVLTPNGKTMRQIAIEGFAYTALSLAIDRLFSMQGCRSGERDPRVVATVTTHGQAVERIAKWFDRLEAWCEQKTALTLINVRSMILGGEGMKYANCFTESGEAKEFCLQPYPTQLKWVKGESLSSILRKALRRWAWWRVQMRRERCYRRAVRQSITPLTPSALTGFAGRVDDPYNFGASTLEHETRGSRVGLFSKAVTMFIIGYWGVEMIEDFSLETLILRALQIALSLAMGVIRYYRSYMYVTEEYRSKIIKKIDCLQMFEAAMRREEDIHEHDKSYVPSGERRDNSDTAQNEHTECAPDGRLAV